MNRNELIDKSIDVLHKRGWKKGSGSYSGDGPICMMQSVWVALGLDKNPQQPYLKAKYDDLSDALKIRLGRHPIYWNDEVASNIDEVIESLQAVKIVSEAS